MARPQRLPPLPLPGDPVPNRRSSFRSALLVIVLIGVTSGLVGGTAATFNGTATNPGFVATPSLPGPAGPFAGAVANGDISLTWTNGGLGNGNEYTVYRSNNGTSLAATGAACPANTAGNDTAYTAGTAIGNAAGTPLNDTTTETMTSTSNGFLCYMLFGAYTTGAVPSAPVWLSHPVAAPLNPIANAHLPLRVVSVIFTDNATACAGASCTLDSTDTIQLTYNQPTTHPLITGNTNVCASSTTGVIYLGTNYVSASKTCTASGQLGSIAPPSGCVSPTCWTTASTTRDANYTAVYTWNPTAGSGCPTVSSNNTVLCIMVIAANNTPLTFKDTTSVWTLTPSTTANVQTNDATALAVCTAGTGCLPGTTTRP